MPDDALPLPRSALVTGGGDGIGRAICVLLARCGVCVTVLDLKGDSAARTVEQCGTTSRTSALALECDVTNHDALAKAFEAHVARWGSIDLCVCNAGVAESRGWRLAIELNVTSLVDCVTLALGHMREQERRAAAASCCRIVCVGSMGGILPMADQPVYAATKAGVLHYVRSVAEVLQLDGEAGGEAGGRRGGGILISAIAPAIVDTALAAEQMRVTEPARKAMGEQLLQGQGGALAPAAIAEAVLRLVTTPAHNGAILRIFQRGQLKFLTHSAAAKYAWSPRPPESLAPLPPATAMPSGAKL
jgi:hypothetical protein